MERNYKKYWRRYKTRETIANVIETIVGKSAVILSTLCFPLMVISTIIDYYRFGGAVWPVSEDVLDEASRANTFVFYDWADKVYNRLEVWVLSTPIPKK